MRIWTTYHTEKITAKYLYRFLTLDYLRDFLKTGSIYFARADRFLDNKECAQIDDFLHPDGQALIEARKKMHLVSCWNLGDTESFAMWNQNHSTGEEMRVVALRFKVRYLTQCFLTSMSPTFHFYYLTEFYMGKVSYFPLAGAGPESLQKSKVLYPMFRKDQAFSFENEFRFVIKYHKDSKEAPMEYRFWLNYPYLLDFDILVSPFLNQNQSDEILAVANEFKLGDRVKTSSLKDWIKQR